MSSKPSRGAAPHLRRRAIAVAAGLFAPILLIWFGAAAIVARGLRFPPALAYSTGGTPAAEKHAPTDARPLTELLETSSAEVNLRRIGARWLRGWLAPAAPAKAVVVLVYPNRVDALAMVSYFQVIHFAGYGALIIDDADLPGRYRFGWEQRGEVLDAVAALRTLGVKRIAVMGVSAGAAAALFAAAEDAPIAAVISDSSYSDLGPLLRRIPPLDSLNPLFDSTVLWGYGLMAGRAIDQIAPAQAAAKMGGRPLMVINGAIDALVPPTDAQKIYAGATGPKELWIAPGAGHAAALATDPANYQRRVAAFLSRYLGPPTSG